MALKLIWAEEFRRLVALYPADPQRVIREFLAYGDLKDKELNEAWAERDAEWERKKGGDSDGMGKV